LINIFDVRGKFLQVLAAKSLGALKKTKGGRRANRSGAADNHVADRCGGFAKIFCADDFEFVWKQSLLDQQNGMFRGVIGDGAKVLRASANGDIHFFLIGGLKRLKVEAGMI
jgi:hypothetical protein